jgi:hypothetical protein
MDPLYLGVTVASNGDAILVGGRDALVTLRSTIDEALRKGRGVAGVSGDTPEDERTIVVSRVGQ